jgi:hypothetical protein
MGKAIYWNNYLHFVHVKKRTGGDTITDKKPTCL